MRLWQCEAGPPLTFMARPVPACSHQGKGRKCTSSIDLTRNNGYKWVLKLGGAEPGRAQSGAQREVGRPGPLVQRTRGPFSAQTIREVGIILLHQQIFILVKTFKLFTD